MLVGWRHRRKDPAQSGREGKFKAALDFVRGDEVCVKRILADFLPPP